MAYIYLIDNKKNWKGYVGCTNSSLAKRFGQHKHLLRRGLHTNHELQKDWDRYGEAAFSIIPLGVCSPEIMYERERYHIARLGTSDPELGYNQK